MTFPDLEVEIEKTIEQFRGLAEYFRPMTIDTIAFLNESIIDGSKKILVEGANATMLDIDFGTSRRFASRRRVERFVQELILTSPRRTAASAASARVSVSRRNTSAIFTAWSKRTRRALAMAFFPPN